MSMAFQLGRRFGPSELVALSEDGPYRLTMPHLRGVIVEYFHTTEAALKRMIELEQLLGAAQGFHGADASRRLS